MSDEVDKFCMVKGFIFQPSFFKQISRKAKVGDRERAYRYICEYMFLGKLPEFPEDDILADFWDGTYPTLHKVKALVLSKLKDDTSGDTSPSTSKSTSGDTPESTSPSTSRSTSIKDNGNGNGGRNKDKGGGGAKDIYKTAGADSARTAPPTLEEAEEFARTEEIRTNVRKFHSYYSARRWIFPDGEPVRDWKALLRMWAERDKPDEKPAPPQRKRYDPEPTDRCPLCGSEDISFRHDYGICNGCKKGLNWDYYNREWKEQKE